MPLTFCLTIVCLGISPIDTVPAASPGPTIIRSQIGLTAPQLIRGPPATMQRKLNSQAEAGLIGALIGGALSAGIVQAWDGHSELDGPSLWLTGLGGAFAGFIIGVLIAGPS
jgi:hypothetical protein